MTAADSQAPMANVLAWAERHRAGIIAVASVVFLAFVFIRKPWIGEDAHITLRTVDNFVNGYGLRWNADERVQTYTHPLWFFIVSGLYFFTREVYFTLTLISLVFAVMAFVTLAREMQSTAIALGILAMICSSRALINYTVSGFENPLTIFIVSIFAIGLLSHKNAPRPPWLRLSVIAAFGMTNRLDTLFVFLPVFFYLIVRFRPRLREWAAMLLGSMPLVAWLATTLVYYGFLTPNTAPAKLSLSVELLSYVRLGLRDFVLLLCRDSGSALLILLGVGSALGACVNAVRNRGDERLGRLAALGAGLLCSCAYTIRVSGDFIIGRFWITHLWLCVILVAYTAPGVWHWLKSRTRFRRVLIVVSPLVVVYAVNGLLYRFAVPQFWGPEAVLPEWRSEQIDTAIERSMARSELQPNFVWMKTSEARAWEKQGVDAAEKAAAGGPRVLVKQTIGYTGLAAGPNVVVIDVFGLGDPLLARLPPANRRIFKSGHLMRWLPRGYLKARESGSLDEMSPEMRSYYEKIWLVTQGPIWTAERMRTIAAFNLGTIKAPLEYDVDEKDRQFGPSTGFFPANTTGSQARTIGAEPIDLSHVPSPEPRQPILSVAPALR